MTAKQIKRRKSPGWYLVVSLVVILGGYGTLKSGKGLIRIWKLSQMQKAEQKALGEYIRKKEELIKEIERLTNDSTYIEEIARREYGMKKENEEVFNISNPHVKKKVSKDAEKK